MFKKILLVSAILAIAIGISACSSPNIKPNQKTNFPVSPTSNSLQKKTNLNNNSSNNSNDNSVVPIPATTSSANTVNVSSATSAQQTTAKTEAVAKKNNIMPAPSQQEDLLKKYSGAIIKTNFGNITLKFYNDGAPIAVNNFLNLAQAGFYNNTKFHRIIKNFMIQGGDPLTKGSDIALYGTGGPGYQFKNEDSGHKLMAGSLAMANAGPNTNGSQFFIVTATATPWLDGSYTDFGQVASGMETVRKIEDVKVKPNPGNPAEVSFPIQDVIINSIELLK